MSKLSPELPHSLPELPPARGAPRLISGRGHAPSFSTPENRQLLAMCSRLRRTLRGLSAGAKGAVADFTRRAQADDRRADEIQRMIGFAKVDERRLARLIEEKESDLRNYPRAVQRLLTPSQDGSIIHRLEVRVTKEVNKEENGGIGFWSTISAVDGEPRSDLRYRFDFDEDIALLEAVFRKGIRYTIAGSFRNILKPDTSIGREWGKAKVLRVNGIDSGLEQAISDEISALNNSRIRLASSDHRIPLANKKDVDDQRRDLAEAQRSAERLRAAGETRDGVVRQLSPLSAKVSAIEQRARDLGIKEARQVGFTGSMTWVMNPDYRGALGAFRNALEQASLKTSELDGLLRMEDLGILDLPMVYERWCLLRIVAVLREHFHLTPPRDFRDHMLRCVTGRGALSLRFEGPAIRRDVLLEYQPRLPRDGVTEKQRPNPDFVLTVLERDDQRGSEDVARFGRLDPVPWARDRNAQRAIRGNPRPCLVLDAKCKPFAALGEGGGALVWSRSWTS